MAPPSAARDPPGAHLRLLPPHPQRERPTAEDDERLIVEFERGVANAGERLYDRLYGVVDAALVRILGGRQQDHSDLVQSAFEQIVSTLGRKTFGRGCSLAGWAAVVTCHVGLNALRARRRERGVVDRDAPLDDSGYEPRAPARFEDQLYARDDLALVRRHLSEMDRDRVTALLLHAMGHDLAEIARLTNSSVAAAQSRLSRGRRELRARLERTPEECGGDVPGRGEK